MHDLRYSTHRDATVWKYAYPKLNFTFDPGGKMSLHIAVTRAELDTKKKGFKL
jgi:hypothetical protein